ncbi:pyridoxal-dependent decarboxylase [Suillus subaureus]|uniref:ornithine decarboxylase n=1 Tax=Suillus subaureus TaxID=48587 RepID=A0A9P7EHC4_9AGAM|nr:pyridoxal-dependent decarboxylase [Suillus subaureus]KAG1820823.1 pyridoxal-dependent decarboxylase [Suillus subaureus]
MSPVEILSALNPLDHFISSNFQKLPGNSDASFDPVIQDLSALIDNRLDDDKIFSCLPPLFRGHPEIHLRKGIIDAAMRAGANEVDAERAFFVADLSQVYRQHERWMKNLPEITPHYAIKCNPDPYVIRLLAALGAGFDCASNGEISQVLSIGGVDPSRIIFANPCKATSFVRSAARAGVNTMTFDNADELYKIARAHPGAKLIVRILADDSKSICRFGIKFGAPLEVVPSLLSKAKELGLDVIGVSFHVGSGCYDPAIYGDAIRRARDVFIMGSQVGYQFSLLDVGGGFEDARFEAAASVLVDAINQYFPDRKGIRLIAEPGRFYVSRAFNYINDGVYGAFNCIMFDHQTVNPYVLSLDGSFHISPSEPLSLCSVWGPTCDSIDCVCKAVELPEALQIGDWLGFDNMGAYTICAASQFNGFKFSNVIYTTSKGGGDEARRVLCNFAAKGYGHGAGPY